MFTNWTLYAYVVSVFANVTLCDYVVSVFANVTLCDYVVSVFPHPQQPSLLPLSSCVFHRRVARDVVP